MKFMTKSLVQRAFLPIILFSMADTGLAQVPVIDLNQNPGGAETYPASSYQNPNAPPPISSLPLDQQVRILQQQITNFTQMDLPGKIDKLQQQIQTLTGQLEEQAHTIQTLNDQQKNFYQDVNQRLGGTQPTNTTAPATTENAALSNSITQAQSNVTENVKTSSQPAITPPASTEDEEKAYQTAFNLLVKKQNVDAIGAFETFLHTYPNSKRAPTAHYWLGELYSTENKNELAAQQLSLLIKQYPTDDKVPDAMLKLAIIDDNNGKHTKAQKMLQDLIQKYPNSSAAKLAKIRLKQQS